VEKIEDVHNPFLQEQVDRIALALCDRGEMQLAALLQSQVELQMKIERKNP
jgi:hypothetical protein